MTKIDFERIMNLKSSGDPRQMAGQLVLEIARSACPKRKNKLYPQFLPTQSFAAVLMTLSAQVWDNLVCPEKDIGDCITVITQASGEGWSEWYEALSILIADNTEPKETIN